MWQLIKIELERAFRDKLFYLAIILGSVIMGVNVYVNVIGTAIRLNSDAGQMNYMGEQIVNVYSAWLGMQQNQYGQLYYFVAPIIAALPYTISLYSDVRTRYVNQIFVRTEKRLYYTAKLFTQFIIGGTVATIPQAVSLIISAMLLPCVEPQASAFIYNFSELSVFGDLFYQHPLQYCILQLLIQFILFGLINLLAYVLADVLDNGFVVMIVPFAIYFFQFVLCEMIGKSSLRDNLCVLALQKGHVSWTLENVFVIIVVITGSYIKKIRQKDVL